MGPTQRADGGFLHRDLLRSQQGNGTTGRCFIRLLASASLVRCDRYTAFVIVRPHDAILGNE
jgi:hypothetical protein